MRITLALLASASLLAACGLKGDLERPVPLWGNPPNEGPNDPRTIKAAEDKAKAEKEEQKKRDEAARAARDASQPATPAPTPPQ
jgi:hypothetical protein